MCMYRITLLIAWYLPSPGKLPRVSKHIRPLCPAGASPPPAPPLLATFRSLTTEHRGEDRTFPPKFKCRAQERCFWERCTVCWPPGLHSTSSHFPIFPSHHHTFSPAFGELVSLPPVSGLLLLPVCFASSGLSFPSSPCSPLSCSPFCLLLPGTVPRARDC